jgi:glycosyltransferase involved in cell wall biosynthesis
LSRRSSRARRKRLKAVGIGYGGEIFSWDLAEALGRLGVEVHLFALPQSEVPSNGFLHYMPSCLLDFFWLYEQSPLKFNKEMFKDDEFVWHDFTHTHIIHDYQYWHGKTNAMSTPWGAFIQRPFYRNHIVTWSKFQRALALQQGYPASTRYVWGGTNTNVFCPDSERPYEKEGYFLFLARMHPDKRPDVFLKLAEAFPNEKFVLSGSFGKHATPDHEYYGRVYGDMAKKLRNVTIVPDVTVEEKVRLLRHARALVHPSVRECFGLSIVEALACGTPAIVSDDGAFPEIIIKGKTGWLCRNFEEYVNAVKNVDNFSPEECRRDAVIRWSRDRVAKEYLQVYEDVIKGTAF